MGMRGPKKGEGGRPKIELDDNDIKAIMAMAGLGLTIEDICLILDISYKTFQRRKKQNEKLEAAYKKGRARHKSKVTSKLWQQIDAGNLTAIIFYLKTQCNWKETQVIEEEGSKETKVQIYLPDNKRHDGNKS